MKITDRRIQRTIKKALLLVLAFLTSLVSMESSADPAPATNYLHYDMIQGPTSFIRRSSGRTELDLSYIRHLSRLSRDELRMTPADFIPSRLQASDSERKIAQQIFGHSIERWLSSGKVLSSTAREALRSLDQPISQSMSLKSSGGAVHKIAMNIKAARALASVTYTGLVKATLAYQVTSRTLGLEIAHQLSHRQNLMFTSSSEPSESRHLVAWQFSW